MSWIGTEVACTAARAAFSSVVPMGMLLSVRHSVGLNVGSLRSVGRGRRRCGRSGPDDAPHAGDRADDAFDDAGQLRHHAVDVVEALVERADDAGELGRYLLQRPG